MIGLPLEQEYSADQGPNVGTFEAAYELASMDTFVSGLARNTALDDMGGKVLSPEELNAKYEFVQKKFNKPMPEVAAFHLNEEGKKRYALQQVIENGPNSSFYNQAVNLGAGIVAHALDPVEFGVGAFAGMGLSAIGARIAQSSLTYGVVKTAGQVMAGGGTAAGRFGAEAVEGIIGNAVLEPFMYNQSNRAMQDYSVEDAFVSVVGGGIAAPAAMFGLRKTWGDLFNKSQAATGLAAKTAVAHVQEGIRPDVDLVGKSYDNFIFNEPPKGIELGEVRSAYRYEPIDVSRAHERSFFAAGLPEDKRVIGEFFGNGTYATDNPNYANNLAGHPMEDIQVDVRELRLSPEARILDASLQNQDLLNNIVAGLPEGKMKKLLWDVQSMPEAWQKIRQHVDMDLTDADAKLFLESIQKRGYDGISLTDQALGHNSLHLFEGTEAKVSEVSRFSPDTKAIPKLDEVELNKVRESLRSPENQLGFDQDTWKQTKDFVLDEAMVNQDIKSLEADTLERLKNFEELAERGILDADSVKEIQSIKEAQSTRAQLDQAANDFANCLASVGV